MARLQADLDILTTKFNAANAEKNEAIAAVEKGQTRLDLANRLTAALADENIRWAANVEQLTGEKSLLTGDVLLASAFISYAGPFTKQFRMRLMNDKLLPYLRTCAKDEDFPMSEDADPLAILTDDATIAGWLSQGLPDDIVSKENGAIVTNSARWPLLIDPQLQGISWISKKEEERGLHVVR